MFLEIKSSKSNNQNIRKCHNLKTLWIRKTNAVVVDLQWTETGGNCKLVVLLGLLSVKFNV